MSSRAAFITDLVMILVFAFLARLAHNSPDLPFSLGGVLNTAWPFWLGVALAWAYLTYRRLPGAALSPAGVTVWLSAVVVGLLIWGIKHQSFPHWSFIIVASVTSAILLFGWRAFARRRC